PPPSPSPTLFRSYVRGHRGDYDRWAQKGCLGWSYAEVLPYFKRCETWEKGETAWRGGSGPLSVIDSRNRDPLFDAWLDAAREADWPFTEDYNGKEQGGLGRAQGTIQERRRALRGARLSAAVHAAAESHVRDEGPGDPRDPRGRARDRRRIRQERPAP